MEIEVSSQHISEGIPMDGDLCPIALSYKSSQEGSVEVYESCSLFYGIDVCGESYKIRYDHDDEVREWIKRYDAEEKVGPIRLEYSIDEGIKADMDEELLPSEEGMRVMEGNVTVLLHFEGNGG